MAPNTEAGGSLPQAMSDPGEGEMTVGEQQRTKEKEEIFEAAEEMAGKGNEPDRQMGMGG